MKRKALLLIILSLCLAICLVVTSCSPNGTEGNSSSSEVKSEINVSKGECDTPNGGNADSNVTTDSSDDETDVSSEVVDSDNVTDSTDENTQSSVETDSSYEVVDSSNTSDSTEDTTDTSEGLKYALSSDGTYYILKGIGTCTDTDIVIPSTYEGLPVTSIGSYAFNQCYSFTSIEIPSSVTTIDSYAFNYCASLTSIVIPNSVTSIGWCAFTRCDSLSSVNYLGTVADWCNINFSNEYANPLYNDVDFYMNGELVTDIVIPKGVVKIGSYAFYHCTSMTSIVISNSVTSIEDYYAFTACTNLTSVTFEEDSKLISIGKYAFSECNNLTSIVIPSSVTSIGENAFQYCTSLTSIEIPSSVTSIYGSVFFNCRSLTIYCETQSESSEWNRDWNYSNSPVVWNCKNNDVANDRYKYTVIDGVRYGIRDDVATIVRQPTNIINVVIPASVNYKGANYSVIRIGEYAFSDSTNLISVEIPNSVTSIGSSAFEGCTNLISIEIPSSVTSVGDYAFSNCTSLTIYFEAQSRPSGWSSYWNSSNCPIVWGYTKEN